LFDEDTVRRTVLERHEQAISFVAEHHDTLGELQERVANAVRQYLPAVEARLHDDVLELTQSWSLPVKGAVVTRYLGFPFWDALVFPVEALTGVGERDTVEVVRMSPRDSCLLHAPDPTKKLAGASLAHFGAFFNRRGRESDYLWGRLDAAERLITLLLHAPDAAELEPANRDACRPAFGAILAEERAPLSHASQLIEYLEQQVSS
jgi:hypothetical protein